MCAYWEGGISTYKLDCALAQTTLHTTNSTEATKRTQSNTEQATRTNVSGQCEVLAKCERTIELPRTLATGAPRADGKSEKAEFGNIMTLRSFWRLNRRCNPKFPFFFLAFRRRGRGRSRKKMEGNFWGCPCEVSSAAEAQNHHASGAYELVRSHHALRACEVGSSKG